MDRNKLEELLAIDVHGLWVKAGLSLIDFPHHQRLYTIPPVIERRVLRSKVLELREASIKARQGCKIMRLLGPETMVEKHEIIYHESSPIRTRALLRWPLFAQAPDEAYTSPVFL